MLRRNVQNARAIRLYFLINQEVLKFNLKIMKC